MRKTLAALAISLLVLSGCAGETGSGEDAKATLVDALRNLMETEAVTQTISVESDVDSLVAVGEGAISEDVAAKILEASLTASGTQAEDPKDASSVVVLEIGGSQDLEMRFVTGDLFVRADVASLLETFGQDPGRLDPIAKQAKAQKGFDWVDEALAGEWVVVRDAIGLTQQMGGTTANAEHQKKIINDRLESVENNATVTSEGDEDAGEHLTAALPMRETLQDLMQSLGPAAGIAGGMQQSLSEIPEGDVVIDFWVADGALSQFSVDVTQFEDMAGGSDEKFPEGVEELTIVVELDEFEGTVEPVAGAAEIDTAALTQALSGLLTGAAGMGSAPAGANFDCSMLKGAPPEVVELYAKECPELQK